MSFPARPTVYKGIAMRSRLEAGFAQWVDQRIADDDWNGGPVVYEPRAYANESGQYLPDFEDRVASAFFEVKPKGLNLAGRIAAMTKMHIIRSSCPESVLQLVIGEWLPDEGGFDFDHYNQFCFPESAGQDRGDCPVCDPDYFWRYHPKDTDES